MDVAGGLTKLYTAWEQMPLADFLAGSFEEFGEFALLEEKVSSVVMHFDFNIHGNLVPCLGIAGQAHA